MSASTIFDGFRALLTELNLTADPDGVPLPEEALACFESRADLDFLDTDPGQRVGGFRVNVNRILRVRQGIAVKTTRDAANKAQLAAETNIRQLFLAPSNHIDGCRKIHYRRSYRSEETLDNWLLMVEFVIEYAETIPA